MFDKLIDLFVDSINLFRFWQVIRPYEKGLVLTLGKHTRTLEPGLYWIWPFAIDEVLTENITTRTVAQAGLNVTNKDGVELRADFIVKWHIHDIAKVLLGFDEPHDVLKDSTYSTVSRVLRESTWEEIIAPGFNERLRKECRKRGFSMGIDIESVEMGDLTRPIQITVFDS